MIEQEYKTLCEFIDAIPEIKQNNKDIILSKSSKNTYKRTLKGLFNKDPELTVSDFIDFDFTTDFININYETFTQKKNIFNAYNTIFNKFNFGNRNEEQKINIKKFNDDFWKKCNIENNKQKYDFNGMTHNKLITIFENTKENIPIYLALALNVLIPPRRSGDYHYAVFVEKIPDKPDNNTNYIVVSDETVEFYFYNIKNSKIYNDEFYYKKICKDERLNAFY